MFNENYEANVTVMVLAFPTNKEQFYAAELAYSNILQYIIFTT